jgi:hypothetical protein
VVALPLKVDARWPINLGVDVLREVRRSVASRPTQTSTEENLMSTTTPDRGSAAAAIGGTDELQKWNWGAFLGVSIWAFGHRLWGKAILSLVVSLVTGGLAAIAFGTWFALKGNRWIWERGGYASHEELRAKERKWAWAFLWLTVGLFVLCFLFAALAGSNDNGDSTVTFKNEQTGKTQSVTLPAAAGGRVRCSLDTLEELKAYDIALGRMKLMLDQVRRQERSIELKYPSHTAPDAVVVQYNALWRREHRLIDLYNNQNHIRNAKIDRDCTAG